MQGESFPAVSQSSASLGFSPLAVWKALSVLTTGEGKSKNACRSDDRPTKDGDPGCHLHFP
jgi:hypothetical protein